MREKSGMSPIDAIELARVYDDSTSDSCYKVDNIKAYLEIVERQLKYANEKCFAVESCSPPMEHIEFEALRLKSRNRFPTPSSCQIWCQSEPLCTLWSWSRMTERCFLKQGQKTGDNPRLHFLSGHRNIQYCE